MRFLKPIVISLASMCAIAGWSADNYLHIRTTTGWQVLNIDDVKKLTFKGTDMVATNDEGATVFSAPKADLVTMAVLETSGVESALADKNTVPAFTFDAESCKAFMTADGDFEMYSPAGTCLISIDKVSKGQEIDLSAVTPGLVILKSGNYSLKTILK